MEHLITLFFATFSAAFMATVPPGLLNMNAAKISVEKGKVNGIIYCLGVSGTIVVQAYIAVMISKYLYNNPHVIDLLLKIALVVFGFFAIYFFVKAKKKTKGLQKPKKVSKKNSFFKGVLLASVNLLTIPYYSGLNAMWNASGWIKFQFRDIATFVMAAGCGTFAVLYLYTVYFNKLETKSSKFSKNSNYIISALMLVLLIITLIRIFYT
ncbi:Threonine/homoserine/homoserine lactone efflux protein [Arenibacter nanhaiticus]|uniref:Threonine/homoserine/homoserine lactone efflux protein n=1 Tax=Arenibacter nanhaiticus TaxID=558155 RepID=A0A1M6I6X2_9FLAO|nr:LysE family transporter [Arenibacter nanhaiticus]SHJ30152.1 Threonine/homoserine/homoserine lactone efflux protein [Arenibacter nanhaiticus]